MCTGCSVHCVMDEQRVSELLERHDLSTLQIPDVDHSSLHFLPCGAVCAVVGSDPHYLVAAVNEALQFEAVADPIPAQNSKDIVDNGLRSDPHSCAREASHLGPAHLR